jgi:hypothetical protein
VLAAKDKKGMLDLFAAQKAFLLTRVQHPGKPASK